MNLRDLHLTARGADLRPTEVFLCPVVAVAPSASLPRQRGA